MINSFQNYLKLGKIKRKTPDAEEAKALIGKAMDRLEYTKGRFVDDKTAKFVLEDSYEAAREAAQALMSVKGFKPYSHEATISFIREFYDFNEEDIYKFDRFRQLRNDSVYKAIKIEKADADSCLLFASRFVNIVSKKL
jgi:uncharacterized protein (UPF0332 family)